MRHGFLLLATVCSAFAAESSFLDTPGPVQVSDLLPPALIENGQCTIATDAHADGLHATYRISSESGSEEITGTQLLANRLRELQAIASLREMNKSAEFGKSLLKSGGEKIQSVAAAVKDPVGTLKNLPQGASKFFGRVGTALSVVNMNDTFQRALVESSPAELESKNRTALQALGASPDNIDAFLSNPSFKSWQKPSLYQP